MAKPMTAVVQYGAAFVALYAGYEFAVQGKFGADLQSMAMRLRGSLKGTAGNIAGSGSGGSSGTGGGGISGPCDYIAGHRFVAQSVAGQENPGQWYVFWNGQLNSWYPDQPSAETGYRALARSGCI